MESLRKAVFFALVFSLALLALTAAVLFLMPGQGLAEWIDWSFVGISWRRFKAMHLGLGAASLVLILLHAALNAKALGVYFRNKAGSLRPFGLETAVGLLLALAVAVDAALVLPPMRQAMDYAAQARKNAASTYGEPPFDRAWASPLAEFCARLGLDTDKAINTLAAKHVIVASPDQTIEDIARKNSISPAGVYDSIRPVKAEPQAGAKPSPLPAEPPAGSGRMTLAEVCAQYGLDTAKMVARLAEADIRAAGPMTLNDMAKVNNRLPVEIYEALRFASSAAPGPKPQPAAPAQPSASAVQPQAGAPAQQPAAPEAVVQPQPGTPAQPGQPVQPGTPTVPGAPAQPQAVQAPETPAAPGQGAKIEPPVGLGKMMISEFCKKYGLDQREALKKLEAKNIVAFGDMTFNEIALENNLTPKAVMEIVTN